MAQDKLAKITKDDFDSIYEKYFNRLVYYVTKLVDCDFHEAENIAQESFTVYLQKSDTLEFENEKAMIGYIFETARNISKNHNRKTLFRRVKDIALSFLEGISTGSKSYYEIETMTDFDIALGKIPETFREVLVLKYISELPIEKIAKITGINEGTVKSRLFNGSLKMAEHLKEYTENLKRSDDYGK